MTQGSEAAGSDDNVPLTSVVGRGPGRAATGMIRRTIKAGCEKAFEDLLRGQLQAAGVFPGFLGAEVILDPGGTQREYTAVFRFDTIDHLRAWEHSRERHEWLGRMSGLIESQSPLSTMCGLETWFTLPGGGITRPPPRHKITVLSWLAAFPVATLVSYASAPLIEGKPTVLRALVLTGVMIPTMAYLVMPRMTRLFSRWLYPGG